MRYKKREKRGVERRGEEMREKSDVLLAENHEIRE
jgi:hypothetical protein